MINQTEGIHKMIRAIALTLVAVLLAGCARSPESSTTALSTTEPNPVSLATPKPTDTLVAPTATPAAPATATVPAPTATPLPSTDTPVPSATPTASPTTTATATATPAAPAFVVSGEIANVRTGPRTDYPVIGQVRQGETYPLTGRNASGSWWEFSFGQGTGWISAPLVESNEQAAFVQVSANFPPAPTATATPALQPTSPPVAAAICPPWYMPPQPGMGVLVIENHDTGTVAARIEEIGTPFEQSLSQKINDVPGRLTIQLIPGRHLFKIEFPICCEVLLEVDIEAGRAYIAPIVKPGLNYARPYSREVIKPVAYPLDPPAGC